LLYPPINNYAGFTPLNCRIDQDLCIGPTGSAGAFCSL
jgi:hypothetical protein